MPSNTNDKDTTTTTTTKKRKNRGKGKAIVARMENVNGHSGVLLASSKKKAISTTVHWNMDSKKAADAFILTIALPDGKVGKDGEPKGTTKAIYLDMPLAQAKQVVAGHPRRVALADLPPLCPLSPLHK